MNPMDALKTYLENREDLKDITTEMMEAAHRLLAGDDNSWLELDDSEAVQVGSSKDSQQLVDNIDSQLRLL
jgi:exonuclease SbcD